MKLRWFQQAYVNFLSTLVLVKSEDCQDKTDASQPRATPEGPLG